MSNEPLYNKHCVPCEGDTSPLTGTESEALSSNVSNWTLDDTSIEKDFTFNDFKEALEFVNNVGAIAEEEGHHPDILIHGFKHVRITLTTHAIGGLSENDFILASKIDNV